MFNLSLLKPLIEPGIMLGKTELIKRFRKFYNNQLFHDYIDREQKMR